MAKGNKVICQTCRQYIDRDTEEFVHSSRGYDHKECFDLRKERKLKKCFICDKHIVPGRHEWTMFDGFKVHKACVDNYTEEQLRNIIKDRGKGRELPDAEKNARQKLYDYCCKLFGLVKPGPKIISQINMFYNKGYSYEDIMFTLEYFYVIKNNDKNKYKGAETIGIVPYVYDEAKRYYDKLLVSREKIKESASFEVTESVITIKKPDNVDTPLYEF